jgi:hypothetical protein
VRIILRMKRLRGKVPATANGRDSLGARPSRSLRGASRAPTRKRGSGQKGVWRDAKHSGRDDRAPPTDRTPEHSRLFASIRGWRLNFLIFQDQLMQVVDFHDIFTYFPVVADISHAFFEHAWRNSRIKNVKAELPLCPDFSQAMRTTAALVETPPALKREIEAARQRCPTKVAVSASVDFYA